MSEERIEYFARRLEARCAELRAAEAARRASNVIPFRPRVRAA